jgi:hypothetical protein
MMQQTENADQVILAITNGKLSHVRLDPIDRSCISLACLESSLRSGHRIVRASTAVTCQPSRAAAKEKLPRPDPRSSIFPGLCGEIKVRNI